MYCMQVPYHGNRSTRPDTITHAHTLVVRVLSSPDKELVSHEVGTIIDHEAATLHPAGVTPAQVGGHVRTVAAGLIGATLKVSVLIEDDLRSKKYLCHTETLSRDFNSESTQNLCCKM